MPDRKPETPSQSTLPTGGRRGRPTGDGRKDNDQRRRNQEHLGVGSDHKTGEMKRHRRGTFP